MMQLKDIFYSKKDSLGNWKKPVNIGYPINSEYDDLSFFVSADGRTAYFSSNKLVIFKNTSYDFQILDLI